MCFTTGLLSYLLFHPLQCFEIDYQKILGYLALKTIENRILVPGVCSYLDAHE